MSRKIIIILITAVAAVALTIFLVYYISKSKVEKPEEVGQKEFQIPDVGADFNIGVNAGNIGEATENPLKNMPSTSPLEEVANPYRDSYKNPFK